jgi:tryptophanyl-tRNA synthetase
METVVSGIRSTGNLHLGNYYGAVQNFVRMQHDYTCFFFIADYHSLTTHPTPDNLHGNVKQVLVEYLAAGLDPEKATLYVQSDVPEIAELYLYLNMNSDTGTNYARHSVTGDGASATAQAAANDSVIRAGYQLRDGFAANIFATSVIDILDYANTNKYTTTRTLGGFDTNGGSFQEIVLGSFLWQNTSAITTIKLVPGGGNFVQYSQFALYGIKGA